MEKDSASFLNYYLRIPIESKDQLGALRGFLNLKLANEGNSIWVTGFSDKQIHNRSIASIIGSKVYVEKGGNLFPINSKLPERHVPGLLWTPIERVLPLTLPKLITSD